MTLTPLPDYSPETLFGVDGLVVVIIGGGTGLGLIMASALENNGATVYIIGRRLDVLTAAASDHSKFNKIIPVQGDITNRDSLLTVVETVKREQGHIDLLINNAGIARDFYPHPLPTPTATGIPSIAAFQRVLWESSSPAGFADTFATNVTAAYDTTVAFLELLHEGNLRQGPRPHRTSQVITVSSSGAFRVDSRVLSPSYTMSKAASTQLGRLLANLLSPWNIRSNVLAPGVWPSEMTTHPVSGVSLSPEVLAQSVPLRRVGSKEDLAGTILFLASRAGAYVNGAVCDNAAAPGIWLVDGGRVGSVASNYS
ncbi:NAD(P)-binding protein [Fistulina hepatica ATCC 64428]|uniref:NAD(P)-binding protein n=1 Tax=Fistulina hepatica ATCC 64428 TaxID=1128425 RepID=A0A0D7AKJ9_9AGAR|nr:NAD(P)-binding protein [Fistulina hepatica ATCC 64428]